MEKKLGCDETKLSSEEIRSILKDFALEVYAGNPAPCTDQPAKKESSDNPKKDAPKTPAEVIFDSLSNKP